MIEKITQLDFISSKLAATCSKCGRLTAREEPRGDGAGKKLFDPNIQMCST